MQLMVKTLDGKTVTVKCFSIVFLFYQIIPK